MKKINEVTAIALGIGFGLGKLVDGKYGDVIGGILVISVIAFVVFKLLKKRAEFNKKL